MSPVKKFELELISVFMREFGLEARQVFMSSLRKFGHETHPSFHTKFELEAACEFS
jgi:hypothetical protein